MQLLLENFGGFLIRTRITSAPAASIMQTFKKITGLLMECIGWFLVPTRMLTAPAVSVMQTSKKNHCAPHGVLWLVSGSYQKCHCSCSFKSHNYSKNQQSPRGVLWKVFGSYWKNRCSCSCSNTKFKKVIVKNQVNNF